MKPSFPRRAAPPRMLETLFVAAFTLLLPAVAHAQSGSGPSTGKKGFVESRVDGGASVTFDDDQALGAGLDPFLDIVKAPPRAARMNLLRPRNNFVSELLKSVENL